MGEIAEGGNFVRCLIVVVLFMGLGGANRLGGDFNVIIWEANYKRMGPFFGGELTPQDTM